MYIRRAIQNTMLQIMLYSISIDFSEFFNMIMISIIFLTLYSKRLSYPHRLNISPTIRKKYLEQNKKVEQN